MAFAVKFVRNPVIADGVFLLFNWEWKRFVSVVFMNEPWGKTDSAE